MKRRENPISLFSFQDIITSLTGVMILIVLIILLQLFDATQQAISRRPVEPERKALLQRRQELLDRLRQLESPEPAVPISPAVAAMTPQQYETMLKTLDRMARRCRQRLQKAEKTVENLKKQEEKLDNQSTAMTTLSQDQRSHKQEQIRALTAHIHKLEDDIEREKRIASLQAKTLQFHFSQNMKLIPLLVECTAWGFRCKRFPDGLVQTFGVPNRTRPSDSFQNLKNWIMSHDLNTHYPVFLFRRGALEDSEAIISIVQGKCQWGKDLVKDGEVCF